MNSDVNSGWIVRLASCLRELVDYERDLESRMSSVRRQLERHWGMPGGLSQERGDNVRRRASMCPLQPPSYPDHPYEYVGYISRKLRTLLEILLEHPALERAADCADGQWAIGLELAPRPAHSHQMIFMAIGLVDYALEHTPEVAAAALADVIQRGEEQDLSSYSIVLFRGSHAESRHDFPDGLSIISFHEARRYMPEPSDLLHPSLVVQGGDYAVAGARQDPGAVQHPCRTSSRSRLSLMLRLASLRRDTRSRSIAI